MCLTLQYPEKLWIFYCLQGFFPIEAHLLYFWLFFTEYQKKKQKRIKYSLMSNLFPKWVCVCFCQALGISCTLGTPQSSFQDLDGSELSCSACEDLLVSLLGVSIPSESQPKIRRFRSLSDFGGTWTPVSVLVPGWSHTPESEGTPGRCLVHIARPPFSQDLVWHFFATLLVL